VSANFGVYRHFIIYFRIEPAEDDDGGAEEGDDTNGEGSSGKEEKVPDSALAPELQVRHGDEIEGHR
jgi:hypothetical protein